jgi:predicted DCC family thiol-disulfide oxidoreductase YuxK
MDPPRPIILYDGVCGLCNRLVQFVIRRDRHDRFRFSPLQSPFSAEILERHGKDPRDLNTIYVVVDSGQPSERLVRKGRGALFILGRLGGVWSLSGVLRILPTRLLDFGYDRVARVRYRLFGKHETCPLPDPDQRQKFIDAGI